MPEIKQEVISYLVTCACDDCVSKPNGPAESYTLVKAKHFPDTIEFEHLYECPHCKKTYVFLEDYPKLLSL